MSAQINIKITENFETPPDGLLGYGFNLQGNPVYIDSLGVAHLLGGVQDVTENVIANRGVEAQASRPTTFTTGDVYVSNDTYQINIAVDAISWEISDLSEKQLVTDSLNNILYQFDGTSLIMLLTEGIASIVQGTNVLVDDTDPANPIISGDYGSADFDHNSLQNTHNLTTDIDHNQLLNFVANEHIDWTNATANLLTTGTAQVGTTTVSGTLTVTGDIVQNGSSYETHAEQVYTKKDLIITRDGAVAGLGAGEYTGFQAKLYDGINDGMLVFDNTGVARVGDVGGLQPLATREETPNANGIVYWDDTNMRFATESSFVYNNSNGRVGIGNNSPSHQLHLYNTTYSEIMIESSSNGDSGLLISDSTSKWKMGINVGGAGDGKLSFYNFDVTGIKHRLAIDATGNVGIGTPFPGSKLEVIGNVTATNFTLSSDIRKKENIQEIVKDVCSITIKQFNFKDDKDKRLRFGVIAQEIEKQFPEFVYKDAKGFRQVAYIDLLLAKVANLENKLNKLIA